MKERYLPAVCFNFIAHLAFAQPRNAARKKKKGHPSNPAAAASTLDYAVDACFGFFHKITSGVHRDKDKSGVATEAHNDNGTSTAEHGGLPPKTAATAGIRGSQENMRPEGAKPDTRNQRKMFACIFFSTNSSTGTYARAITTEKKRAETSVFASHLPPRR